MANLQQIWSRAKAARQLASEAESPMQKELGEADALYREQKLAQNEIARAASAFLKQNGFLASGLKPKRRR